MRGARWNMRVVAPIAVVALATVGVGVAAASGGASRSGGPDYVYGANPFADATASVLVVATGNGKTHVTLHLRGVDAPAGQRFGAHVHEHACGSLGSDAGAHYQQAGVTGTLEAREIWLDFTVNRAGNAHAEAVRPWSLDQSAPRSVIVHALPTAPDTGAAGARLACIDLDGEH
jgi:superoxide dismutase, Cu-Zn family